jgi:hypothetical protein
MGSSLAGLRAPGIRRAASHPAAMAAMAATAASAGPPCTYGLLNKQSDDAEFR